MTSAIVVGAGLAGLVAARELIRQGHEVTVLEAADRIGGQIHTVDWHGRAIDTGAEAMFLGGPQLKHLLADLGLIDDLVAPRPGSSWLRSRRGLTPLPEGVGPTGPTKLAPVVQSGLLSPFALARAGLEPLLARKRIDGDVSVGEFITRRFGRAVADTFVDPMLGNLHAGDIHRLSLLSTAPQLAPAAQHGTSLIRRKSGAGFETRRGRRSSAKVPGDTRVRSPEEAARGGSEERSSADGSGPKPNPEVPAFASFATGLSTLVTALADGLTIHTGTPARAARRTESGWQVDTDATTFEAEHLFIAAPAAVAGTLLDPCLPGLGGELTTGRVADVATMVLAYPATAAENPALRDGNGLLLQSGTGRLLKAATFLSRKWAHLAGDDLVLVRASAGRAGVDVLDLIDDRTVVRRIHAELAELTGLDVRPVDALVTRWPQAYPQLEVGHAARMAVIRERLAGEQVRLIGGPYDGLGMPSVVKSALAGVHQL